MLRLLSVLCPLCASGRAAGVSGDFWGAAGLVDASTDDRHLSQAQTSDVVIFSIRGPRRSPEVPTSPLGPVFRPGSIFDGPGAR